MEDTSYEDSLGYICLAQAAERSLSGRRRSSVFWIAGGTYAWSRVPMSVPGGTISSIRSRDIVGKDDAHPPVRT
jgi:hypothetical protein